MSEDILERKPLQADYRVPYGKEPLQFGDLWLPGGGVRQAGAKPAIKWPVLLFVHGGWWKALYGLEYASFLCDAMRKLGVAVWSLEYRRVGDAGGGWPGTFLDVAQGTAYLKKLAEAFPLDLERVVAAGHSAGGQLAFWLAGRHHIPHGSVLASAATEVQLKGLAGLAGAVDLRLTIELGGLFAFTSGKPAVIALMGGVPQEVPERYAAGNPGDLLPLGVPQALVQGTEDDQIPPQLPERWATMARRQGDPVTVHKVPGADHFDVVDPQSAKAWPVSRDAMLKLLRG